MKSIHRMRAVALLMVSLLVFSWVNVARAMDLGEPERVLQSYLVAHYARDAETAWQYLADVDRQAKSLQEYRTENGDYSGFALTLSRELAGHIEFGDMTINIAGDRATIEFSVRLPDANHQSLRPLVQGFDSTLLSRLDQSARDSRLSALRQLAAAGDLQIIESPTEKWDLVQEGNQWRVFVNWAEALEVTFESTVSAELGWEFVPTQTRVLAQPGQTIQMAYRAHNTGAIETTGKARHTIGAADVAEYLEIIACFCFIEQTLAAGESIELPLVFRVDYDVPDDVSQFSVNYEFFEQADFPLEGSS